MKAQNITGQQNNSGGNAPTFVYRKDKCISKHTFIIRHKKQTCNKNPPDGGFLFYYCTFYQSQVFFDIVNFNLYSGNTRFQDCRSVF